MPTAPKKFRAVPIDKTAKSRAYDQYRGTSQERGYDAAWDRYSKWFRRQPENISCACGCRRPSQCVDHVIACEPGSELWNDMGNHQAMTRRCHTAKTIRFDGGCGKAPDTSEQGKRDLAAMAEAARARAEVIQARIA